MDEIISALLDMEQQAETTLSSIKKERERLPARIDAETKHVRERIFQETAVSLKQLRDESENYTASQVKDIEEENARHLIKLESDFAKQGDNIRTGLFAKLTSWTP